VTCAPAFARAARSLARDGSGATRSSAGTGRISAWGRRENALAHPKGVSAVSAGEAMRCALDRHQTAEENLHLRRRVVTDRGADRVAERDHRLVVVVVPRARGAVVPRLKEGDRGAPGRREGSS